MDNKGNIEVYRTRDGSISVEVKLEGGTVWLTQKQMAALFKKDIRTVNEHILNIFKEKELKGISVIRKSRITARDGKTYETNFYNLDVVISVGYRVKSQNGTRFRIWATTVLRKHLIEGYTLNERRLRNEIHKLDALRRAISLIGEVKTSKELDHKEAMGLLAVISDFNYALGLLDDYDKKNLKIRSTSRKEKFRLTYEDSIRAVDQLRIRFGISGLFGKEKDRSFRSSVAAIYQTFNKRELYPSIEEKAANLLYFIVKNHSFVDGNKRIAASMFLWFLGENTLLYRNDGTKRIADNALVALTLMIAESKPADRDTIVTLTVNLINRDN